MSEIPEEKRPTCSCGEKMTIEKYQGYYEEFNYFVCDKCSVDADDYDADYTQYGAVGSV